MRRLFVYVIHLLCLTDNLSCLIHVETWDMAIKEITAVPVIIVIDYSLEFTTSFYGL